MIKNLYRTARYLKSIENLKDAPPDTGGEIAFIGRSNVGKSSALNRLTDQKALARISKTPGRTQMINFFEVNQHIRLVDLPGYGFAKVPKKMIDRWRSSIQRYLSDRKSLTGLVLLIDVRHPLKPQDAQMLEWCVFSGIPTHILLTKADKLSKQKAEQAKFQIANQIKDYDKPVGIQLFSSTKGTGLEQLISTLDLWLAEK